LLHTFTAVAYYGRLSILRSLEGYFLIKFSSVQSISFAAE